MVFSRFTELDTARLRLRKLRRTDAADFFRFAGSESVTRYMLWNTHASLSESGASIAKTLARYETGKCYRWGIALKQTDTLIGIIDLLSFNEERNTCSFAYMLAESCWGLGYGTEALKAVLDFAFREMDVSAVEADHFRENEASGAVMRKAGMEYVRTEPGKYEKNGCRHDAPLYRIERQTWINRE